MKVCWVLRCHISFCHEESGLTCPDSLVWLEGRWLILPAEWEGKGAVMKQQTSQSSGAHAATHGCLCGTSRLFLQDPFGWLNQEKGQTPRSVLLCFFVNTISPLSPTDGAKGQQQSRCPDHCSDTLVCWMLIVTPWHTYSLNAAWGS